MAIEIVSFPIKFSVIFHSFLYVYQAGYPMGPMTTTEHRSDHWGIIDVQLYLLQVQCLQ